MQHSQGTFKGVGELDLYYQRWSPLCQRRAILIIVHGLGGHSGLFHNLVQQLVPQGYEIYGFDLRGHGRSPGQRGHINSWAEFREDLNRFLGLIQMQTSGLPCFLLGHSLGGAIALDYILHFPVGLRGVIVTAPVIGKVGVSSLRIGVGRLLSWLWPSFTLNTGIEQGACSRDPAVVTAYAQDPLRHTKGSARLVTEFLATSDWVQTHIVDLQTPILILHGGADRVAPAEESCSFFQQVIFSDKERREYPESYHELYDDINHQEVLTDLSHWLEQHLQTEYPLKPEPSSEAKIRYPQGVTLQESGIKRQKPAIEWLLASDS